MASLRLTTAGESHGPGLTCIVEGLPAGLELDRESIDADMARRQLGHGRGGRMKIERDAADVTAGVRHGRTLGGPVALQVANRDYANWADRMSPWPVEEPVPEVHLPRPGHADLVGVWKYGFTDVRNVLERASARETAARVAGGALCKAFLRAVGVDVRSHVVRIGTVAAAERPVPPAIANFEGVDDDPVRCLDPDASGAMVEHINVQRKANESIGGVFEVIAFGLVPGLGSHVSWEERLDGRIGGGPWSLPAAQGGADGGAAVLHPGRQGRRVRRRLRPAGAAGLPEPRRDLLRRGPRLPPRDQPRRRPGGRHDDGRAADGARRHEADPHADQAAAVRRHLHA